MVSCPRSFLMRSVISKASPRYLIDMPSGPKNVPMGRWPTLPSFPAVYPLLPGFQGARGRIMTPQNYSPCCC